MTTQDEIRERLERVEKKLDDLSSNLPIAYVQTPEYDRRLSQVESRVTIMEADRRRDRDEGMKVYAEFIRQYSQDNQALKDMITSSQFSALKYMVITGVQIGITTGAVFLAHYVSLLH